MIQKHYHTKTKDLINEYLQKHNETTFTASDIFDYLKNLDETVNVTTVYRNMEKLVSTGVLIKRKSDTEDAFVYQVISEDSDCTSHIHLQCTGCGKIYHLECDFMSDIMSHLSAHHKFTLDCKSSVLKGLCEDCSSMKL